MSLAEEVTEVINEYLIDQGIITPGKALTVGQVEKFIEDALLEDKGEKVIRNCLLGEK